MVKASKCYVTDKEYSPEEMADFSPQFEFFHLMKDGESQGRILAAFHIFRFAKGARTEPLPSPRIF